MGHDASKVLLGVVTTSDRDISNEPGDPATFVAGLAVRRATSGALQLADDSTAALIGVSLGPDLSGGDQRTAVCRAGDGVPLLLTLVAASLVRGNLTFTAKAAGTGGNAITIALVNTGSLSVGVVGSAITININSGVSTATAIKAAVDASAPAFALIATAIEAGQGSTAQVAAASAPLAGGGSYSYVVKGAAVKIDPATGKGSPTGDEVDAIYTSGLLTGVYPDGTTAPAALIDMGGGF